MKEAVAGDLDIEELMIDSTIIPIHQHGFVYQKTELSTSDDPETDSLPKSIGL